MCMDKYLMQLARGVGWGAVGRSSGDAWLRQRRQTPAILEVHTHTQKNTSRQRKRAKPTENISNS